MWKPALVHHCSITGQCVLWLDRHCYLAATSIGFRNKRCMIVWLSYCHCFTLALGALTLLHIYQEPPGHVAAFAELGAWIYFVVVHSNYIRSTVLDMVQGLFRGWHSRVLLMKFLSLLADVGALVGELEEGLEKPHMEDTDVVVRAALKELREARSAIVGTHGPWGPFRPRNPALAFNQVFGPSSLAWALPLQPGGIGDPLNPDVNTEVCEAWATFGAAVRRCQEVRELKREAEAKKIEHVRKLLGGVGLSSATASALAGLSTKAKGAPVQHVAPTVMTMAAPEPVVDKLESKLASAPSANTMA